MIAVALIVAALVLCTSVALGAAAAYALYRLGRRAVRHHRAQVELAAHRRAELLARAEIQHRWWLDGDPRGTYGRFTPAPTGSPWRTASTRRPTSAHFGSDLHRVW